MVGVQKAPPKPDPWLRSTLPLRTRGTSRPLFPAPAVRSRSSRDRPSGSARPQFPPRFEGSDKAEPESQGEVPGLPDTTCSTAQSHWEEKRERRSGEKTT